MCKAKIDGGLLCGSHIKKTMAEALLAGDDDRYEKAKFAYRHSIRGIKDLKNAGFTLEAEVAQIEQNIIKLHNRLSVAHTTTRPDHIIRLAEDASVAVRYAVAGNTHTPESVLTRLSRDKNWAVRVMVAKNPHTPESVLTRLSRDKNWAVRDAVAQNPSTSEILLAQLAHDVDHQVVQSVLFNVNVPEAVLKLIVNNDDTC